MNIHHLNLSSPADILASLLGLTPISQYLGIQVHRLNKHNLLECRFVAGWININNTDIKNLQEKQEWKIMEQLFPRPQLHREGSQPLSDHGDLRQNEVVNTLIQSLGCQLGLQMCRQQFKVCGYDFEALRAGTINPDFKLMQTKLREAANMSAYRSNSYAILYDALRFPDSIKREEAWRPTSYDFLIYQTLWIWLVSEEGFNWLMEIYRSQ